MRKCITIFVVFLLSCSSVFAADTTTAEPATTGAASTTIATTGVLNDSDIPALRDALKKTYNLEMCHNDLPNASTQTCACLADEMAKNLNADKLKLCQKEGYDACVAAEFTAAKSNLTDKQINDCKALTTAH